MYVGVGLGVAGPVVLGEACANDTCGFGLAFLCLGLGRGLSFDPLIGANWDWSSRLSFCGVVTVAATRIVFAGGVAARAGVAWLTERATRNAAPNAARMQMMAVPANRTGKWYPAMSAVSHVARWDLRRYGANPVD